MSRCERQVGHIVRGACTRERWLSSLTNLLRRLLRLECSQPHLSTLLTHTVTRLRCCQQQFLALRQQDCVAAARDAALVHAADKTRQLIAAERCQTRVPCAPWRGREDRRREGEEASTNPHFPKSPEAPCKQKSGARAAPFSRVVRMPVCEARMCGTLPTPLYMMVCVVR